MKENHYRHRATMAALSFAAMYTLMYAMVDVIGNVFNSVNQVYMAGLMTAPMIIIGHAFLCMSERTRLFESREHHADRRSAGWIHQFGRDSFRVRVFPSRRLKILRNERPPAGSNTVRCAP